ncbi:MAG: hypothetical protein RLZZ383_1798 [Pseudomonadota bacterium]
MASLIVATAGHIDHGKTTLVRALTGVDLDRAPEERARGITLHLGVAGAIVGGRAMSFVDVPGHERLVRTMIAGAAAVDVALLVVSAEDGVMPQTEEHAAVLAFLGVPRVVVALTKVDRADPDLLALIEDDVHTLLARLGLARAATVAVSAKTGEGLPALIAALAACPRRDAGGGLPVSLWVDQTFSPPGHGTVVTGTLAGADWREGSPLWVAPDDAVRARAGQTHGATQSHAAVGTRLALNLPGRPVAQAGRGTRLVGAPLPLGDVWDVVVSADSEALPDDTEVLCHLGTAEAVARLRRFGDDPLPGRGWAAQLRLHDPIAGAPGERFVLRRPSPAATLGGGRLLDPWAGRARLRDRTAWCAELARLCQGDASVFLERGGEAGWPASRWASRRPWVPEAPDPVRWADVALAPAVAQRHIDALWADVGAAHRARPHRPRVPRVALWVHGRRALSERAFEALLQTSGLCVDAHGVADPRHVPPADATIERVRTAVAGGVAAAGLEGLGWDALHALGPEDAVDDVVLAGALEGVWVSVAEVGWVGADALSGLRGALRVHFASQATLSPADVRAYAPLSRRALLPLLAWCDRQGWTRRRGDSREAGPDLSGAVADG